MMDATTAAVPVYFGTMEAERRWLAERAERDGPVGRGLRAARHDHQPAMGVASLLAPMVLPRLLAPFTPRTGRYGKALVASAIGAGRGDRDRGSRARRPSATPRPLRARRGRSRAAGGVASVVTGGVAITTTWSSLVSPEKMWNRRVVRDLGSGPLALGAAVFGWDFIYYWNHRFMHESRYMWAIHVVHHSSERYNLSTALRQPVADALGTFAAVRAAVPARHPARRSSRRRAGSTCCTSTGSTPTRSAGSARSSRCSTRRRTTGSTTASTRSTSTATTAAS